MQKDFIQNSLCILIVTYNRCDSVNYYLENRLEIFKANGFDIVVYDSSKNDMTKNIVLKYINNGYSSLKYVHYKDPADDPYGRKKAEDALKNCAKVYDYVWLCGDQAILQLEEFENELHRLLNRKYDLIHIYSNNSGLESKYDIDYVEFLKNFFWSMTHWCSFILSKPLIEAMIKQLAEYGEKYYITTDFVFSIFSALAKGNFKIAYLNHAVLKHSPCRTLGVAAKDMFRAYAEEINVSITQLPKEYDTVKELAKKGFSKNTGTFSWQGAIDLRANGNLTLHNLQKYKKHLQQMTEVPMIWFYLWSIMPKWIAKKNSNAYIINEEGLHKLHDINKKGSRLILYGAGGHGIRILKKINYSYNQIEVVAISDKNWTATGNEYHVVPPDNIPRYEFDYVAIAIIDKMIYKEVKKMLIKMGIPGKKIFHI